MGFFLIFFTRSKKTSLQLFSYILVYIYTPNYIYIYIYTSSSSYTQYHDKRVPVILLLRRPHARTNNIITEYYTRGIYDYIYYPFIIPRYSVSDGFFFLSFLSLYDCNIIIIIIQIRIVPSPPRPPKHKNIIKNHKVNGGRRVSSTIIIIIFLYTLLGGIGFSVI